MPRAKELVEPYSIYLTFIGSPTTTKTIEEVHCMAKIS
jgi:hypothetical protein